MLTRARTNLLKIASFLGIVEGLSWAIVAIIGVARYVSKPPSLIQFDNYMDYYSYSLYNYFLFHDHGSAAELIDAKLRPNLVFAFLIIYIILGIVWIALSIDMLFVLRKRYDEVFFRRKVIFLSWTIITIIIACVDIILMSLIGQYFNQCIIYSHQGPMEQMLSIQQTCYDIFIPMVVIAGRGFILWLINIIFAYICYKIYKDIRPQRSQSIPPIPRRTIDTIPQTRYPEYDNQQMPGGSNYPRSYLPVIPTAPQSSQQQGYFRY